MLFQPPLPPKYGQMSEQDMCDRIRAHKAAFGERLVILGHHYQRDNVVQFADLTGPNSKMPSSSSSAAFTSWLSPPTS